MANYATLKAAIEAAIYENHDNEITGDILQETLLAMVNSLGADYQFVDIATPTTNPGTPDQNVFYIASTTGTYSNFNGLVVNDGEIAILKYNGTWTKNATGAASLAETTPLRVFNDSKTGITSVATDYVRPFKAGQKVTLENKSTSEETIYLFVDNGTGGWLPSYTVPVGNSITIELPIDTPRLRVYHVNNTKSVDFDILVLPLNGIYRITSVSGTSEVLAASQKLVKTSIDALNSDILGIVAEPINKVNSNLGFSDTKSGVSTVATDYYGDFVKGQRVIVENSPNSEQAIFLFVAIDSSSWEPSIQVGIGQTLDINLDINSPRLRIYHTDNTKQVGFTITIGSQLDILQEQINSAIGSVDNKEIAEYYSKKLASIGDSYSAGGLWQNKVKALRGFEFNADANARYSIAETRTIGDGICGLMRAKRLVEDAIVVPDVIIIENVNDSNLLPSRAGTSADEPYMISDRIDVNNIQSSIGAAESYFQSNFATILSGVTPKHGVLVGVPYSSGNNASTIQITSGATQNGVIYFRYGSKGAKSVPINGGDSVAEIIEKIMSYDYAGYQTFANNDTITFTPLANFADNKVTLVGVNCGAGVVISNNQTGILYYLTTYKSHDLTNWSNPASWVGFDTISLWSAYKGLFNYLSEHFPDAEIYMMHPIAYNVNVNSPTYQNADGSINTDSVLQTVMFTALKTFQKEVCEYCKIQFLDLAGYACIYPQNVANYFPANNYHPLPAGYERWGVAVAKLLL